MKSPLQEKPNAEPLSSLGAVSTFQNGRYMPPPADGDGKQWVRTSALIQREPQELYEIWHRIEDAPRWQEQVEKVTRTGEKTSHWVMRTDKATIEWDAEVMADEPGKRIAWRSIGGDLQEAGEVVFEPAPGGRGTFVTVLQEFELGKLASVAETLTGRNPKQAVVENLRHFKALAEAGEIPRNQGPPHGPRGLVGKMKASLYAETVKTPPSQRQAS